MASGPFSGLTTSTWASGRFTSISTLSMERVRAADVLGVITNMRIELSNLSVKIGLVLWPACGEGIARVEAVGLDGPLRRGRISVSDGLHDGLVHVHHDVRSAEPVAEGENPANEVGAGLPTPDQVPVVGKDAQLRVELDVGDVHGLQVACVRGVHHASEDGLQLGNVALARA